MPPERKLFSKRILEAARNILVELLIVFVGVYLAFELNEFSHERDTNRRREQLLAALIQEIDNFVEGANHVLPQIEQSYAEWNRRYEGGKRPDPLSLNIEGVDRPPRGMWQAAQASGGLTLLSVQSMRIVSDYYNALDVLLGKYSSLIEFSEKEILPVQHNRTFYEKDGRTLNPMYTAYMRRMKDWLRLFREVQRMAEQSKESLRQTANSSMRE